MNTERDKIYTEPLLDDIDFINVEVIPSPLVTVNDYLAQFGLHIQEIAPPTPPDGLYTVTPLILDSAEQEILGEEFPTNEFLTIEFAVNSNEDALIYPGTEITAPSIENLNTFMMRVDQVRSLGGDAVIHITQVPTENGYYYLPTIKITQPFVTPDGVTFSQDAILSHDGENHLHYINPIDGIVNSYTGLIHIDNALYDFLSSRYSPEDLQGISVGDWTLGQTTQDGRLVQLAFSDRVEIFVEYETPRVGTNIRKEPTTDLSPATFVGQVSSETGYILNTSSNKSLLNIEGLTILDDSPFISALDTAGYRWYMVSIGDGRYGWVRSDVAGNTEAFYGPTTPVPPKKELARTVISSPDLLIRSISSSEVETFNSLISRYPGGDLEKVFEYAHQGGIEILGWDEEFHGIEGRLTNGETVYYMPDVGTEMGSNAENDDLMDGWVRYGGSIISPDLTLNFFTSVHTQWDGKNIVIELNPYNPLHTNPDAIKTLTDNIINTIPTVRGKSLNIIATADDRSRIHTNQGLAEVGYTQTSGPAGSRNYISRVVHIDEGLDVVHVSLSSNDRQPDTGDDPENEGFAATGLFTAAILAYQPEVQEGDVTSASMLNRHQEFADKTVYSLYDTYDNIPGNFLRATEVSS